MIHFHSHRNAFELQTENTVYLCYADDSGHLRFAHWGLKNSAHPAPLFDQFPFPELMRWSAQETWRNTDEVAGYGDEAHREPALAVDIPELPVDSRIEAAHLPVRDCRLRFTGHHIGKPSAVFAGKPSHGRSPAKEGGDWLCLQLQHTAYPLELELCLRPIPEHDIIERYIVLKNAGDQTLALRHLWAASLQLPHGHYSLTHLTGAWGAEFTREHRELPIGATLLESRNLNTSLTAQPTAFLQPFGESTRTTGITYGAQLAWSGHWRIHIDAAYDRSLRVHLGENPADSARMLSPGEVLATPMVISGCADGGEEGLRRCYQAYHKDYTLPALPEKETVRPVLYNSWEATYFNLSTNNQIELARRAAKMGVELFVVDDGWFGDRRHDKAGLGDWRVSPEVFPEGLQPLIREVHQLGMKFGIWFEPEMVNPDSELYRAHPDWVLHFPSTPRLEGRNQLLLDFGNPDVVENILGQMIAILDEYPIDYIKWDMNRAANAPGSKAGEQIWRKHVEAVHYIMDSLLKRYPKLVIQSCSSGGGRVDASILARCCQVWTSDNTDAYDRIAIQDGYTLTYPTATMEAWVTHTVNHQTRRYANLDLRFASAMRGVLGIGSSLDQLDDEQLEQYQHWIGFYKKVRHLVQNGILHRAALPELHDHQSVWQFTATDQSEAYVSAIRTQDRMASQKIYFPLADLQPDGVYDIFDDLGEKQATVSGAELMTMGMICYELTPSPRARSATCWHFHLIRQ